MRLIFDNRNLWRLKTKIDMVDAKEVSIPINDYEELLEQIDGVRGQDRTSIKFHKTIQRILASI